MAGKNKTILAFMITLIILSLCGCSEGREKDSDNTENQSDTVPIINVSEKTNEPIEIEVVDDKTEDFPLVSDENDLRELIPEGEAYSSKVDDQLRLITDCYAQWRKAIEGDDYGFDMIHFYKIAVTDLNHNDRLELIITTTQGSGCYSNTVVYEVDETYTCMKSLTEPSIYANDSADFLMHDVFECYYKDGRYYYVVEDYISGGWDLKDVFLYAYSFDGEVKAGQISGFSLRPEDSSTKDVDTYLYDSDNNPFSDKESYRTYMENYWNGYEKQPMVEILWRVFPEKDECADIIRESYEGYNPNSPQNAVEYTDFEGFYGEGYEYRVVTP